MATTGNFRKDLQSATDTGDSSIKTSSSLRNQNYREEEKELIKWEIKKQQIQLKYANKLHKQLSDLNLTEQQKLNKKLELEQDKFNLKTFAEKKKYYEKEAQLAEKISDKVKNWTKALGASLGDAGSKLLSNASSTVDNGINSYISSYTSYLTTIDTRLQGSNKTFSNIANMIGNNIGLNPLVQQSKIYSNLSKLVGEGISYSVEQRAFLATVSEKIANTFDAANGTLLQLIRIQQSDTTAARLGIESALTKFLNQGFGDTSYLNNLSNSVSRSILGANSQLSTSDSVGFEYVVQKWLGSLSSVGVNDATISSIAEGLNSLGTGDVNSLSNNSSLQNLLVMASNKAGLNYADLLTGGLSAGDTNKLMKGLVEFIQGFATTDNKVVKSQYANIFGLTISDLTSILNLSTQDLVSISENMLDYSGAISETMNQLNTIGDRTTISERVKNVYENYMTTIGSSIATNAASYTTWLLADVLEKSVGGIAIPTMSAFGNSIDLNTTVSQIMKTGIVGISTLAKLPVLLSSLLGGSLSLNDWGVTTSTSRGTGFSSNIETYSRNTSASGFYGDVTGSDLYKNSINEAESSAKDIYSGKKEDELLVLIRDKMALDLHAIYTLLGETGIVIREMPSLFYYSGANNSSSTLGI